MLGYIKNSKQAFGVKHLSLSVSERPTFQQYKLLFESMPPIENQELSTETSPNIPILFEDNHLLVVNKPAGVLSQEDHTNRPDLLTLCKTYLKKRYNKPGNVFLGLVHRLDRPVSGVMVFAKTSKAASRLNEQIRSRSVKKTYRAVLCGNPPPNGVLENHLEKDREKNLVRIVSSPTKKSKQARLSFQIIRQSNLLALADINLETGRAHQIRVQFAGIGAPVWGDKRYGKAEDGTIALHSQSFRLIHPTQKKEMTFTAAHPSVFPWTNF